jgi:hypothetical protein
MVGACVPFYFCPRSVMLYLLCRGNHPDLSYRDGQEPILHLEGDLREVVAWAEANSHRWAFSLSNAGARYTEFRHRLGRLGDIDWASVAATDFRNTSVREAKQAEFLVERNLPFSLIKRVGAYSTKIAEQVQAMLGASAHRPKVEVRREWYF